MSNTITAGKKQITILLAEYSQHKCVVYFGRTFYVPESVNYMATDKFGTVRGFEQEPNRYFSLGIWDNDNGAQGDKVTIARGAELDGISWTGSCRPVTAIK